MNVNCGTRQSCLFTDRGLRLIVCEPDQTASRTNEQQCGQQHKWQNDPEEELPGGIDLSGHFSQRTAFLARKVAEQSKNPALLACVTTRHLQMTYARA
ncbi:hypothetical protein [Rhizobium sp. CF122]|uniref:hypothetical protein n=1 Tax=Rhizobium sp. CF122 TaxID=1144312 RepID=UPI001FCB3507|nr:hypothetical protein [Rhizobium sp. CF122]